MMHTAELDSAVGCSPRSFLKIRISRRNKKIRKYFSLYIGTQMSSNHEKNKGKKSRDTLPLNPGRVMEMCDGEGC